MKPASQPSGIAPADTAKIVDTYCVLSKQLSEEYRDRRSLEWRMHTSLWTILAAGVYLCVTKDQHWGVGAWLIFLAVPVHLVWTIKIWRGQLRDQLLSIYYRDCAVTLLRESVATALPAPPEVSTAMPRILAKSFDSYLWWLLVVLGPTILICTVAVALIR